MRLSDELENVSIKAVREFLRIIEFKQLTHAFAKAGLADGTTIPCSNGPAISAKVAISHFFSLFRLRYDYTTP